MNLSLRNMFTVALLSAGISACSSPPPTVALLPTNTAPAATSVPPTQPPPTAVPSTATPVPPTPTTVPATATPTAQPTAEQISTPRLRATSSIPIAPKSNKDRIEIEKLFEQYRVNILGRDGVEAARLVDRYTINYYDEIVRIAGQSNDRTYDRIGLASQLLVLRLRNELTAAQLAKLDGRSLYVEMVNRNWIGRESTEALQLAEVRIDGARASASLKMAPEEFLLPIIYEDGGWKLGIHQLVGFADVALRKQQSDTKLDDEAFLKSMVEIIINKPIDPRTADGPVTSFQRVAAVAPGGVFTTTDGKVTISAGRGWLKSNEINSDASLVIARDSGTAFLLIISEDPDDFESFEDFARIVRKVLPDRMKNPDTGASTVTSIGPLDARQFNLVGGLGGLRLKYLVTLVKGKSRYYQILTWTVQGRYAEYEEEFKKVLATLREL